MLFPGIILSGIGKIFLGFLPASILQRRANSVTGLS
jgi:hypothetical protein